MFEAQTWMSELQGTPYNVKLRYIRTCDGAFDHWLTVGELDGGGERFPTDGVVRELAVMLEKYLVPTRADAGLRAYKCDAVDLHRIASFQCMRHDMIGSVEQPFDNEWLLFWSTVRDRAKEAPGDVSIMFTWMEDENETDCETEEP